jgi:hypothetical protein
MTKDAVGKKEIFVRPNIASMHSRRKVEHTSG